MREVAHGKSPPSWPWPDAAKHTPSHSWNCDLKSQEPCVHHQNQKNRCFSYGFVFALTVFLAFSPSNPSKETNRRHFFAIQNPKNLCD
jgi:hypothetical protein